MCMGAEGSREFKTKNLEIRKIQHYSFLDLLSFLTADEVFPACCISRFRKSLLEKKPIWVEYQLREDSEFVFRFC